MTQNAKMRKIQMFDFVQNHKKTEMEIFAFCVLTLNQSEFRPVKHLKMTVSTSVLLKIHIHMAKTWSEMVITLSFISISHFRSDYSLEKIRLRQ
jgi:ABC-type proline/glycine betaine transport system permease subunit